MYDDSTMTEPTITNDAVGPTIVPSDDEKPAFDPVQRARELAVLDALRSVVDPEIGMNVVELALIKQVILGDELSEQVVDLERNIGVFGQVVRDRGQAAHRVGGCRREAERGRREPLHDFTYARDANIVGDAGQLNDSLR